MSAWVHIAGMIRLDHGDIPFPRTDDQIKSHLISILSRPVTFEDLESLYDQCKLPMGDEGSVDYIISTKPDEEDGSHSNVAQIGFWGDLRGVRDQDVPQKIETWVIGLQELLETQHQFTIRELMFVANSYSHKYVWVLTNDKIERIVTTDEVA